MQIRCLTIAIAASTIAGAAHADIVAFSDFSTWSQAGGLSPGGSGSLFASPLTTSLHVEDFDALTAGASAGSFTGGTAANWWRWTASASSGTVSVGDVFESSPPNRFIRTTNSSASLVFNFNPTGEPGDDGFVSGLRGIGGGFSFFSASGSPQAGQLTVRLSNGSSVVRDFTDLSSFAGFWVDDPELTIMGLTVRRFGSSGTGMFAGSHTLYLGYAGANLIPAPGAVALLGAAGLIGITRRRG